MNALRKMKLSAVIWAKALFPLWRLPLGKLRILSGKEICKILQQQGFEAVRQKGIHVVMQKVSGQSTITVPVPQNNPIKTGTLLSIIRQSQLPRSLFELL